LTLSRAASPSYESPVSLESRIGMNPNTARIVSHADAHRAADDGARAARISKTMMMPITTPIEAGRTRAS
jgi:hypothetical protein